MFVVPFTHTVKTEKNIIVNVIKILTIGGNDLWEETSDMDIQSDILIPNGLFSFDRTPPSNGVATPIFKLKGLDIYMCEIDSNRTNIADFYKWEEISDSETFCWRSFYHITDLNNNIWLPIPDNEKISNFKIIDIINAILLNSKSNN
jgi:hypothetical protein